VAVADLAEQTLLEDSREVVVAAPGECNVFIFQYRQEVHIQSLLVRGVQAEPQLNQMVQKDQIQHLEHFLPPKAEGLALE
jgi:oligoribonuclease (3'-5' exoribonuclease)